MRAREAQDSCCQHIDTEFEMSRNVDGIIIPAAQIALGWAETDALLIEIEPIARVR